MIPRWMVIENGGRKLAGSLWIPEGEGPFPAMLLCHGFTGSRIENQFMFPRLARRLVQDGIAALTVDFAGSGESEGEFSEMTVPGEIDDALAALDALKAVDRIDDDRVGILGYSLGGCVAACVLGRREDLRCGVLWAPVADLAEVVEKGKAEVADTAREEGREPVPAVGNLLLGRAFFETVPEVRPLEEISRARAAVLVLHGSEDEAVPPEHGRGLADAAPDGKCVLVDGAGHGFQRPELCGRLFSETADWILKHLKSL